jgi:quercetin dioxygenase-like cupin family protein
MNDTHTHFLDLAKGVQPPDKDILSRTLFNDDRLKVVAFGFAQGEELSEHTASMPAVLHFLQGEAKLTLGDDRTRQRRAPGSTCLPACATASRPRHPWSCCCCC